MAIKQQQVIFTIKEENGKHTVNLKFNPGICGEKSADYKKLSEQEKNLQYIGAKVGSYALQALKRDGGENE